METKLVVTGKASAIAASPDRLYAANNNTIKIYSRYHHYEQERIVRTPAKQLVYDNTAKCVAVLVHSRGLIYSADLRKQLHDFDSGSASLLASHGGTFVLASKRRLRWAKQQEAEWKTGDLPIAGVSALEIRDDVVYAASGDRILMIDLTARLVRTMGIKLPTSSRFPCKLCFTDALVVVAGTKGWYNQQEFDLEQAPAAIASLGSSKFWLCAHKARIDLYYGNVVAYTLEMAATCLSNDGFLSCQDGVYELNPHVTTEFIQKLAQKNLTFALSLAEDLDDPEINKLRQNQAHSFLAQGDWKGALKLLQQAQLDPQEVISEAAPYFNEQCASGAGGTSAATSTSTSTSPSASITSHASTRDRLIIPQVEAYIPYLTQQRRRLIIQLASGTVAEPQAKDTLKCIDNALFSCYFVNKSSLIGALVRNSNYCDAEIVVPKLKSLGRWRDLVGFLQSRSMHAEALELLAQQGTVQDSAAYLEHTKDWSLVQKFAGPVLKETPDLAEQLFSSTSNDYDPHKVYDFLLANKSPYALRYLEQQVASSSDSRLHHDLAVYYLDHNMTQKLDELLKTSNAYRPQELLPKIPPQMYQSRAILYSKMGRHDKVIAIFVEHDSIAEARQYCLDTLEKSPVAGKLALTHLYENIKGNPQELVHFVNSLGHHLDCQRVLSDLPPNTNMQDIAAFFGNQSRQSQGVLNLSRLTKALKHVYLSESTFDLAHLRDQAVQVHTTSTCAYCKKRLGQSVLGVWKGLVLHYGCIDAYKSIY